MVVEDHPNMIPLVDLNRRPRGASVEAPDIDRLHWADFLSDNFGNESEDFGVAIHRERQITDIRGDDGHVEGRFRMSGSMPMFRIGVLRSGPAPGLSGQFRCGKHSGAKTQRLLKEGATRAHKNSSFAEGANMQRIQAARA